MPSGVDTQRITTKHIRTNVCMKEILRNQVHVGMLAHTWFVYVAKHAHLSAIQK